MCHADVDEMANASSSGGADGVASRHQVHRSELRSLPRIRFRHAHQMHQRIPGPQMVGVRAFLQGITAHGGASGRQLLLRAGAYQRANFMTTAQQLRNEVSPQVASPAGNKHGAVFRHLVGPQFYLGMKSRVGLRNYLFSGQKAERAAGWPPQDLAKLAPYR